MFPKLFLDCAVRGACRSQTLLFRVSNDEMGIATLVQRLQQITPDLVVFEATGGFEAPSVATLAAAQIPLAVVNPRQVREGLRPLASWPKQMRSTLAS
jgi:transposase